MEKEQTQTNVNEVIKENRKHFEKISNAAVTEFDNSKPCIRCKFFGIPNCGLTCGIAMKHISRKNGF